jgi:succinate-acetate transporter protein
MTRIVGLLCALGSFGLFWTLGVFVVVPWRAGRMLALNPSEMQVIGVSLLLGCATLWGASRIFAAVDQHANPRTYTATRVVLVIAAVASVMGGISWTLARVG